MSKSDLDKNMDAANALTGKKINDAVIDKKIADIIATAKANGVDEIFIAASLQRAFTEVVTAYAGRMRTPAEIGRLSDLLMGTVAQIPH